MELTRRDAMIALSGIGLSAGVLFGGSGNDDRALNKRDIQTLLALATTLYPTSVDVTEDFIEAYVTGQDELDSDHTDGLVSSLQTVRRESLRQTGRSIRELSPSQRSAVLRATGADRAYPDPNGTDDQQIRYYIINNLLYALYTTPKGGDLIGNPNPPGHPGGTEAYQEVPEDE